MKMKLLLILSLLFIIPAHVNAQMFSLDDLYRRALEKSETIQIAKEDLFISERDKDRAVSTLLPTLSAFGNHTRYTEEKGTDMFLLQPDYSNEWGLRLDQSFSLSGRELTAFRIAGKGIEKSSFDLETVKEGFLFKVASEYFVVLGSKKAVEIADQNVKRLTKHRDAARTRVEVGEATKTVLLRAEAELAGAYSELIKAENNLIIAKARLAKSANIEGDYGIKEPEEVDLKVIAQEAADAKLITEDCKVLLLDCLIDTALSHRAEIKSAAIQREIAEDEVTYTRGSYWPDLSVEGVYMREENDPSSSFELNERIYGTLKLNFPFFEGGLRKAEVGQAAARQRQAEYNLEEIKRAVSVEVENAYLVVKREAAVLTQLEAEVAYGAENYNSVVKQFQYGLADSIDVMDANTLLVTAERELAAAKYSYQLAIIRLRQSTGTLLKSVIRDRPPEDMIE